MRLFLSLPIQTYSILMLMLMLMFSVAAMAQSENTSDWPCIQALVPEISFQVIWAGPSPDSVSEKFAKNEEIIKLATKLTERRVSEDSIEKSLEEFSLSTQNDEQESHFTALFFHVLKTLNNRRKGYIDGIKRYTRQQNSLAKRIEAQLNEIASLEGKSDESSRAKFMELEENLHWIKRMFLERERTIAQLCEQPIHIEEQAGQLARAIAAQME